MNTENHGLNAEKHSDIESLLNNRLKPEERQILQNKGTERAFTGEYWDLEAEGLYVCRRCRVPLYRSDDKFDSRCGWPSFDDEFSGAVTRRVDADGRRTEILCASCGGHLGHVFTGEKMTEKNTRHCVNSLSLKFIPARGETGRAVFAGGCFWGMEYLFRKTTGVLDTTVGYSGGKTRFPSYRDVCNGNTGHLEVLEVIYDPEKTSYENLARYFFEIHDPVQKNGQGPDIGEQYLSAVFYENPDQKKTAEDLIALLKSKGVMAATAVLPAASFWPAEDYHQDYYAGNGKRPYCHIYTKRF